jgi:hypothetical protein
MKHVFTFVPVCVYITLTDRLLAQFEVIVSNVVGCFGLLFGVENLILFHVQI